MKEITKEKYNRLKSLNEWIESFPLTVVVLSIIALCYKTYTDNCFANSSIGVLLNTGVVFIFMIIAALEYVGKNLMTSFEYVLETKMLKNEIEKLQIPVYESNGWKIKTHYSNRFKAFKKAKTWYSAEKVFYLKGKFNQKDWNTIANKAEQKVYNVSKGYSFSVFDLFDRLFGKKT